MSQAKPDVGYTNGLGHPNGAEYDVRSAAHRT
jgi:hypothetical protein